MKITRHLLKLIMQIILLIMMTGCGFGYQGCSAVNDEDLKEDYLGQQIENVRKEEAQGRIAPDEDMVLASGEILKVRLHYGKDTLGDEAWYKVRLENQENHWYDYVEITAYTGFGNSTSGYDDYTFTATNFNHQYNTEHYAENTIDGKYLMTITGSNGYYLEKSLEWASDLYGDTGGWKETDGLLAYTVP